LLRLVRAGLINPATDVPDEISGADHRVGNARDHVRLLCIVSPTFAASASGRRDSAQGDLFPDKALMH
jgi:hypothetical protein